MIEEKRREIARLLNHGFDFEVKEIVNVKNPGFFGFLFPKVKKEVVHVFRIKEPTLSVLDRISLESIDFDESIFNNLENDSDQKKYSKVHLKRVAKIIAIMVCGPGGRESEIHKLQSLFFKFLRPSEILSIIQLIDIASNLGDFINSTRLLAAANVLEEKKPIADQVEEVAD